MRVVEIWHTTQRGGRRVPFMVTRTTESAGPRLTHPGLAGDRSEQGRADRRPLRMAEIEQLAEDGLIRLRQTGSDRYQFEPTADGLRVAEQARLQASGHRNGVRLDWQQDVLPVLQAAYEAAQGQSAFGFEQGPVNDVLGRDRADAATDRVLHELVRTGYLEEALGGNDDAWGPHFAHLTEKGYQQVAGWPGRVDDSTYGLLMIALDERIKNAATDDERTKWERLREATLGIGRDLVTDILSKVLTSQV